MNSTGRGPETESLPAPTAPESSGLNPALLRERAVVAWLNAHPQPSPAGRCAWCAGPAGLLLPYLAGEGHTWLHGECWAEAEAVLRLSFARLQPYKDRPQ